MEYGCIGEKLGHSFSREIHEALCGYRYELKELAPREVGAFLKEGDFRGINVTIPYKETVIPYLDEIDEAARAIGAVNTIVRRDGKLLGFNTDHTGMRDLLRRAGIDPKGKKVLIAGSGGTSKTALAVARALGAREARRVSRTGAQGLITYEEAARDHADAEIWIQATPCGMFPKAGVMPFDPARYPRLTGVMDAIYNPLRSRLVLEARARGARAAGGLYMLVAQAARAAEIFTGDPVGEDRVEKVYRDLARQKEDLVLVGMPGCGKSTLGRMAAKKLGMDFFDADEVLQRETGLHPADFIRQRGEEAFRDAEEKVLRDLSARHHAVIATGGGAVLRRENVLNLKGNGRIVFIDRAAADLPVTADRPLSSDRAKLARLYEEREPLYRAAADEVIAAVPAKTDNVNAIVEAYLK